MNHRDEACCLGYCWNDEYHSKYCSYHRHSPEVIYRDNLKIKVTVTLVPSHSTGKGDNEITQRTDIFETEMGFTLFDYKPEDGWTVKNFTIGMNK
jgi:hypothetical protein